MTEGFRGFAGVLKSCHRGNHTLIFHEVPSLPVVVIYFLCCSFHMKLWVPFSGCLGGIMKSNSWKQNKDVRS